MIQLIPRDFISVKRYLASSPSSLAAAVRFSRVVERSYPRRLTAPIDNYFLINDRIVDVPAGSDQVPDTSGGVQERSLVRVRSVGLDHGHLK